MESSKYTILVVDDEDPIRDLVVGFLERLGHQCVRATDGIDALDKIKENKIDAIVTDIKMPQMDGITLTKEILQQYPGVPVMVMTGFAEEYTAANAISAGARDFIQKPFSVEEFTIRFNKMIKDSQTVRPASTEKDEDDEIFGLKSELEQTLKKG